jgi:hypothetical protein
LNVIDGAARAQRAATKPVATRRPTSKLTQDETSERRAVDEFLRHANQTSGRRILKKDIWQAARYRDQSQFLMFQAGRASDSVAERFRQILDRDPGEFAQERRKPRKPPTTIS